MMAAKKQPQPTLAERLEAIHIELNSFIDRKADELKATSTGSGLPLAMLRGLITRNTSCLCQQFMNAENYGK